LGISDSVAIEICESEIKWPSWKELGLVESRMIRRYENENENENENEKEKEKEKEKEAKDSSKSKGTSSRGNEESAGGPRMGRS
jgi:hypothetical protein